MPWVVLDSVVATDHACVVSRGDRIAGVLVGGVAGDALGAPYEFGPHVDHVEPMIGGGPFNWEPGEST
jgi:hypothetical protein